MLRLPLLSLPYTFNPDAMDENAEAISENLFSRLVRLTSTGELLPDLAAEWSFNDAATELTLTLRQGVTWHDGQPFTADDVVWTLSAIRSQSGVLYEQFSAVKDVWSDEQGAVHISFERPSPLFVYTLAEEGASILPKHLYDGQGLADGRGRDQSRRHGALPLCRAQRGGRPHRAGEKRQLLRRQAGAQLACVSILRKCQPGPRRL